MNKKRKRNQRNNHTTDPSKKETSRFRPLGILNPPAAAATQQPAPGRSDLSAHQTTA